MYSYWNSMANRGGERLQCLPSIEDNRQRRCALSVNVVCIRTSTCRQYLHACILWLTVSTTRWWVQDVGALVTPSSMVSYIMWRLVVVCADPLGVLVVLFIHSRLMHWVTSHGRSEHGVSLPCRPLRGRGWMYLLYPKNPTWRWRRERSRPQGPKNVHDFLITVRPMNWACGHGTEMLLILKNLFLTWLLPDISRYDSPKKCPMFLYAVNLWLKPVSATWAR